MNYGIYLWNAWNLSMEIMEFMDFNDIKPYISGVYEPRQVQKCNEKIPRFSDNVPPREFDSYIASLLSPS